jgi:hypothetical protein
MELFAELLRKGSNNREILSKIIYPPDEESKKQKRTIRNWIIQ